MAEDATQSKKRQVRRSKADWLGTALDVLAKGGIEAVRVERLAARLGIAKSGFYYHFRDREDLCAQMLAFWEDFDGTPLIRERSDPNATPEDRLLVVAEVVDEANLARFDTAIRQWAIHDPKVFEVWNGEMEKRIAHIRGLFAEIGFTGDNLEMRTRTYVAYQVAERELFVGMTSDDRRRLRKLRIAFLTRRE